MISKKAKARQEARKAAEKAYRQATVKACGYSALKNKHRSSTHPPTGLKSASSTPPPRG